MAAWIAAIWLLSSLHPFKKVFAPSYFDGILKPCFGTVSIILTGILYSKTYFALRKQSASMIGKKSSFSSAQGGKTSKKIDAVNQETREVGFVNIQDNHEGAQNPNMCAQTQSIRAQNQIKRVQTLDENAQIQVPKRPQNCSERAEGKHQRSHSKDGPAKNQYERAESHDKRVQNKDERAQNKDERAQSWDKRAQSKDERAQCKNERVDCAEILLAIQEKSTTNITCSTDHKQSVTNAKEQRFLNTIIIIALIAVVTVMSGTIYVQILPIINKKSPNLNTILRPVLLSIYSLNFAVNPFVYCLRLKQYRKTFQMVYSCDLVTSISNRVSCRRLKPSKSA